MKMTLWPFLGCAVGYVIDWMLTAGGRVQSVSKRRNSSKLDAPYPLPTSTCARIVIALFLTSSATGFTPFRVTQTMYVYVNTCARAHTHSASRTYIENITVEGIHNNNIKISKSTFYTRREGAHSSLKQPAAWFTEPIVLSSFFIYI